MNMHVKRICGLADDEAPQLDGMNFTLDPDARAVHGRHRRFGPAEIADAVALFEARQAIAHEVERLLAILDATEPDADLEMNVDNMFGDPRLDDGEGLTIWQFGSRTMVGDEDSEAADESGIGDLNGLLEQTTAAYGRHA